jgi:hypothetical protein
MGKPFCSETGSFRTSAEIMQSLAHLSAEIVARSLTPIQLGALREFAKVEQREPRKHVILRSAATKDLASAVRGDARPEPDPSLRSG